MRKDGASIQKLSSLPPNERIVLAITQIDWAERGVRHFDDWPWFSSLIRTSALFQVSTEAYTKILSASP
jgi:hypothetical protein